MGNARAPGTAEGPSVLILYGDPPNASLEDSTGRSLGKLTITARNQVSFERALRRAVASYLGAHVAVSNARLIRIASASDFASAVKRETFTHLIYYGHAVLGANALLPSLGKNISSWQIVDALKGKNVKHFDMLGCETMSLGADLSIALPGVEVGYLRSWRHDNFEVDRNTFQIKNVRFDPTPLRHYTTRQK